MFVLPGFLPTIFITIFVYNILNEMSDFFIFHGIGCQYDNDNENDGIRGYLYD